MDDSIGDISLDLKFYKKSAAVQFTLIKPNQERYNKRIKPGSLLVEIAKSNGEKSYDWENKIKIALNVNELGTWALALSGKKMSKKGDTDKFVQLAEFVHDPNIGRSNSGTEVKSLGLSQMKDSELLYLSLRSTLSNYKNISIALTPNEVHVLRALCDRAIVRTLGW